MQDNPPAPGSIKNFYPKIASIDVPDKYTVKLNMSGPDPTVAGYLAWARYSPIVPVGMFDKVNHLTQGIGTGPFKLVEYVQNDRVVYHAQSGLLEARPAVPRRAHAEGHAGRAVAHRGAALGRHRWLHAARAMAPARCATTRR